MKRYLTLTIAIMMNVALAAITAQAQGNGSQPLRAHVPFAFNVGAKSLPAGDYTITVLNPASDRKTLQIRSIDGRVSAIIQTNEINVNTPEHAKLVFNRYGDQYFFAQAHMAGDSSRLAAVKSNAERDTEQTIASRGRKKTVVIVAT